MIYVKLIQRCKGSPAMAQRILFAAQTLTHLRRSCIWIGACVANPRRVWIQKSSLQTGDAHPMLVDCWASVADAGPAVNRY